MTNEANLLKYYPIPSPAAVGRQVDQEAVLVLTEQGQVKVLNELGARIWELSDGTRSVAQIADQICREYEVERGQAEADTLRFLEELAGRGALTLAPEPA